jgi:hypothetical protein
VELLLLKNNEAGITGKNIADKINAYAPKSTKAIFIKK